MKKGYLLVGILCLALVLPGCATFRKGALELTEEYVQNVETEMEISRKLLAVWPYRSCQLRAALGPRIAEFPGSALKAWDDLDKIAEIEDPTDCELGTASGSGILMTYEAVRKAVEIIAPDVLDLLPLFL